MDIHALTCYGSSIQGYLVVGRELYEISEWPYSTATSRKKKTSLNKTTQKWEKNTPKSTASVAPWKLEWEREIIEGYAGCLTEIIITSPSKRQCGCHDHIARGAQYSKKLRKRKYWTLVRLFTTHNFYPPSMLCLCFCPGVGLRYPLFWGVLRGEWGWSRRILLEIFNYCSAGR